MPETEAVKPTVPELEVDNNAEIEIDNGVANAVLEDQTNAVAAGVALDAGLVSEDAIDDRAAEVKDEKEEALADRVRIVSPFKLVIKRFFRSRLSVVGLTMFLAVLVFSFIGPLFVPWGQSEIDYSPAERIYYSNISHTAIGPDGEEYTYYRISVNQPGINKHAHAWTYGETNDGERALHVLGTDNDGYDILARLMYGGRMSLMLSFLVVLIYTVLGIILGGLAGYFGGWVDMIIMRVVDILNCIPSLPILLIVGAIFDGTGWNLEYRIYIMLGALTLLSWPGTARLVRGQILFLREQEYMVAADALGFGVGRKIFKHLVPNVMPQLIVSMTLGLGGTILTEASLSFLGLGVPSTLASLGQMVSLATNNPTIMQFYIADWLPAGLIIIIAVVAFNFIGDGLRDALDPKMKR
ncbi:MAG: ABC transporter permease [Clostridiales bacterium]|nr:ABC transporter permease [Clostridiales bacterium]